MRKNPGLWPKYNQNFCQNIEDIFQHNIERISYYEELYQIESKKPLELTQEVLHPSKIYIKVEHTRQTSRNITQ